MARAAISEQVGLSQLERVRVAEELVLVAATAVAAAAAAAVLLRTVASHQVAVHLVMQHVGQLRDWTCSRLAA